MGFIILPVILVIFSAICAFGVQIDKSDYIFVQNAANLTTSTSTNTYAEAYNYGLTHPTRDGESWSGW